MSFEKVKVYAFVGPSGTGKSYRAQMVASEKGIHFIIDDGLLIKDNEIIAGESAKKAPTKIETVKHALFYEDAEKKPIEKAIKKYKPAKILILGTSDGMVQKIAANLGLPEVSDTTYINQVATEEEMTKKGIDFTYSKMIENINDIAGVRVICPLKKDIYTIRKLITNLPGIKILKEKDYITNPKKSGYSSYHMILEVPVTLSKNSVYVKVEVQIRTMAMDFWASLEHKMKYKNNKDVSKNVSKELVQCAKIVNKLDNKMLLLNS